MDCSGGEFPAALELMPMPDYREGRPWWFICDDQGIPVLALPKAASNAVADIYGNPAWYGLMPNESIIDPAGIVRSKIDAVGGRKSVMEIYVATVNSAVDFRKRIVNQYHRSTYALYGDDKLRASDAPIERDTKLMTFGTVTWKGALPSGTREEDLLAAELLHDDHKGTWRIQVCGQVATLKVQGPDEPGDGTVPATSAASQLGGEGVHQVFKQWGFEHQFCFAHPWARWAALYGVAQVAQLIPEPLCHA